jgi:hypothetical protein
LDAQTNELIYKIIYMDIYGLAIVYDSKRLHKVIPATQSFRPFLNKKNANAKLKKKRKK